MSFLKYTIVSLAILGLLPLISYAQTKPGDVPPTDTNTCLTLQNNMGYRAQDISTNGEVSILQDFLSAQGYLTSSPTGFFGLLTVNAVKNFQSSVGLSQTGYVGPLTRGKIHDATCSGIVRITIPGQTQFSPITITQSPSTNTYGLSLQINTDGGGTLGVNNTTQNFSAGTFNYQNLLTQIQSVPKLSFQTTCAKSASFGVVQTVTYNGQISGDLTCTPDQSYNLLVRAVNDAIAQACPQTACQLHQFNQVVSAPSISSINIPTSVAQITVYGNNLDQVTSLNYAAADGTYPGKVVTGTLNTILSKNSNSVTFLSDTYMANALVNSFTITVFSGTVASNVFVYTPSPTSKVPSISSLSPSSGPIGTVVTVNGSSFTSDNTILLNGSYTILHIVSTDGHTLSFTIPSNPPTAPCYTWMGSCPLPIAVPAYISQGINSIAVQNSGGVSNSLNFTFTQAYTVSNPTVSSISPISTLSGSQVTVFGSNFDQSAYVEIDGVGPIITANAITPTSLTFTVPQNLSVGSHTLQVGLKASPLSNSVTLTIVNTTSLPPFFVASIQSISPASGPVGTVITVYGSGFSTSNNTVYFLANGASQPYTMTNIPSNNGTMLTFNAPTSTTAPCPSGGFSSCPSPTPFPHPGTYSVSVNNGSNTSNTVSFTLTTSSVATGPTISSLTPASAPVGGTVTISGSNFDQYSFIALDGAFGLTVYLTSQTTTSLGFTIPTNVGVGSHTLQVGEKAGSTPLSNPLTLVVQSTAPVIQSLSLSSALPGWIDCIFSATGLTPSNNTILLTGNGVSQSITTTPAANGPGICFTVPNQEKGTYSVSVQNTNVISNALPLVITGGTTTPTTNPTTNPIIKPITGPIQVLGTSTYKFTQDLNVGSQGQDVVALQQVLTTEGFFTVPASGYFGAQTQSALKLYQTKHGIPPLGIVGPLTRLQLNK